MNATHYRGTLDRLPVDFFADPDGDWTYESLIDAAGFEPDAEVAIGALAVRWRGHPEGAAVVAGSNPGGPIFSVIECSAIELARSA